jgi:hypothetical protein
LKGKTNMSAKALATGSFEPAAERTVATDHPAPGALAAEIQFREDLWREYRLEAIHAGCSTAEATEYASALSPEMGLVAGVSETAPVGRSWFYQSSIRVVKRTNISGLITLAQWEKSKTMGQTAAVGASIPAPGFRPWNAGGKS